MKHLVDDTKELSIVYSKPLKRFLCFCLDIVVFLILGFLIYGVSAQPIVSNMSSYKKADTACNTAIETANRMYTDSHLAIFDGENYNQNRALEEHLSAKLKGENDKDIFVYFYTVYAPDHLTGPDGEKYSYTVEKVNKEIYSFDFQEDAIIWGLVDSSYSKPLKLTDEAITQIKRYQNNEIDATSEKYYLTYKKQAERMMNDAASLLMKSKEYKTAKEAYNSNTAKVLIHYTYSAIILYTILFIGYYIVFPLLVGDGKTLGKFLLGYSCFSVDRRYVKKKNVILRAVLQYLSYFFICGFFPFLQVGLNIVSMPLIIIGDYTLTMIIPMLISLLLSIVSFFVMVTSGAWQSLHDLCSKTIVGKIEEKPIDPVEEGEQTSGK